MRAGRESTEVGEVVKGDRSGYLSCRPRRVRREARDALSRGPTSVCARRNMKALHAIVSKQCRFLFFSTI